MCPTKTDDIHKSSAGRPRSEASRAAILDAAYGLLRTKPIAAISMICIARRAGVSKATIYRWWPTKEALLLEAFLRTIDLALILKSEGSPLLRLRDYVIQVGRFFTGEAGVVVARLLTAIQDNAILRKEFMERIYSPRNKEIRAIVKEAINRHQLPVGLEVSLFLDTIVGALLVRLLIRHERIDEQFVGAVFDHVVAGTTN
jgi:AcrR family transcriptional regulator